MAYAADKLHDFQILPGFAAIVGFFYMRAVFR